jgi:hypothetical protein
VYASRVFTEERGPNALPSSTRFFSRPGGRVKNPGFIAFEKNGFGFSSALRGGRINLIGMIMPVD